MEVRHVSFVPMYFRQTFEVLSYFVLSATSFLNLTLIIKIVYVIHLLWLRKLFVVLYWVPCRDGGFQGEDSFQQFGGKFSPLFY